MNEKNPTGPWSIRDLLDLTKNFRYFRYLPPGRMANVPDSLELALLFSDSKAAQTAVDTISALRSENPGIAIWGSVNPARKLIQIEILNSVPENMTRFHFHAAEALESKIIQIAESHHLTPSVPFYFKGQWFDPALEE